MQIADRLKNLKPSFYMKNIDFNNIFCEINIMLDLWLKKNLLFD